MYDLPYHKERDFEKVKSFISEYPFATLTGCTGGGIPVATQVPVFLEEENGQQFLRGHIMRNMDHHLAFAQNENVLVVFTGPQIYVSGSWYSTPNIPSTWNYMSVHARGVIRFLENEALQEMLRRTSLYFEDQNQESPTIYDNLPKDLTQRLEKMIVAFEIVIEDIDTVFKISQDRDQDSYRNIIEQLKHKGENGQKIAAEMEQRIEQVFSTG